VFWFILQIIKSSRA